MADAAGQRGVRNLFEKEGVDNVDFWLNFSTLKIFNRQWSPRMAYLLRKMVGATGIEPVTPAV